MDTIGPDAEPLDTTDVAGTDGDDEAVGVEGGLENTDTRVECCNANGLVVAVVHSRLHWNMDGEAEVVLAEASPHQLKIVFALVRKRLCGFQLAGEECCVESAIAVQAASDVNGL